MEDDDFDPFSDLAGDPSIPQYLENISQLPNNQTDEDDHSEDEFVELQNGQGGDDEAIPDLNIEVDPFREDEGQHSGRTKRRELNGDDRVAAYEMLLQKSKNGKLHRDTTVEVAEAFNWRIRSVQRLWKRGRESGNHNVRLNRANSGRKRVEVDWQRIREIPLRKRTTLRNLSTAMGVSRKNLSSGLKSGEIRRHSNAIKPILTEENRLQRIQHCLSMMDPDSPPGDSSFQDMTNVVHIDEKWFHLTKKTQSYYLLADEDDPVRKLKSTNFLPKIMFLAAVARPRYASDGSCSFDGKLGIFPLVEEVCAVRSSANRAAGTLELKVIERIDRDVIRKFMIENVLLAIRDKWPVDISGDPIIIQQDNAKTHILVDDVEFSLAVTSMGLNVKLSCQPPNSPDLNVLDLGFFRAIQSLQQKECARSVLQLVAAVKNSFYEFSDRKCNYIFLTLQSCMVEILNFFGENTYKIPHMSKESLERQGQIPLVLSCDPLILETARAHLLP